MNDARLAFALLTVALGAFTMATVISELHHVRGVAAAANARAELADVKASVAQAVAVAVARAPAADARLELLLQRTEYLREVMEATCTRDGFGLREHLPTPPPGWPAIPPAEHAGPWQAPP